MLKASIVALLVALPAAAAGSPNPLLGIVGEQQSRKLVRVDPQELRPLAGQRIEVGSGGCAPRAGGEACWTIPPWTFSPDRVVLAVARNSQFAVRSLRLVDVRSMRVTTDVRVPGGPVGGLAWLSGGRVLALQEVCCSERQRLVAVDLARRRVVAQRSLGGSILRLARTAKELVVLLTPARTIGSARLAVADARGTVRFVGLERIAAGSKLLAGGGHRIDYRRPGLAVDPVRRRAFVVGTSLIAEVDLSNRAVSYHELPRSASLFAWLRNSLEPAAHAKESTGAGRIAHWLGGGILAVSGTEEESSVDAQGNRQMRSRPAGLLLVDTRDWSVRTIDRGATSFLVAGELLVATGSSWDSQKGKQGAIGLSGYAFDGSKRFQLFEGDDAWIAQVYEGVAHVGISRPDGRQEPLKVVDLAAGRVIGERTLPLPWLVVGAASGWWDS